MTTAAEAIYQAMTVLGGEAEARDVRAWVEVRYPKAWRDVTSQMADLAYPGNASSTYPVHERFLERVARGRYRLR
jgi:hypothetical protein